MNTTASSTFAGHINQGLELMRRLGEHLEQQDSSPEVKALFNEIMSIFEKANSRDSGDSTGSPLSFVGSPCSESHERLSRAQKSPTKKRKTVSSKWTSQVRLGSGPSAQGPFEDGHSWRKYGQKEILGAKHPRGYYRCTHRNSQGCMAMKQVQRSDEDPSVFDVTYRGTHTCQPRKSASPTPASSPSFPILDQQNLLLSFQTNLKVKTENLGVKLLKPTSSTFSLPSTPVYSAKLEDHFFSPSSTLDNCFKSSFTDAFISPATSESNYFSSDFNENIYAETPSSMDFLLDSVDFDTSFPYENSFFQ